MVLLMVLFSLVTSKVYYSILDITSHYKGGATRDYVEHRVYARNENDSGQTFYHTFTEYH